MKRTVVALIAIFGLCVTASPTQAAPPTTLIGDSISSTVMPTLVNGLPGAWLFAKGGWTAQGLSSYLTQEMTLHPRHRDHRRRHQRRAPRPFVLADHARQSGETHSGSPLPDLGHHPRGADTNPAHSTPDTIAPLWNARLRQVVKLHRSDRIVDWDAAVAAKPSLAFDGLHPTASGAAWFVRQYHATIAACH